MEPERTRDRKESLESGIALFTFQHLGSGSFCNTLCWVDAAATAVSRTHSAFTWRECLVHPASYQPPWLIFGYVQTWFHFKLHSEFCLWGGPSHFPSATLILNTFNMLDKNKLSGHMKKVHFSSGGGVE